MDIPSAQIRRRRCISGVIRAPDPLTGSHADRNHPSPSNTSIIRRPAARRYSRPRSPHRRQLLSIQAALCCPGRARPQRTSSQCAKHMRPAAARYTRPPPPSAALSRCPGTKSQPFDFIQAAQPPAVSGLGSAGARLDCMRLRAHGVRLSVSGAYWLSDSLVIFFLFLQCSEQRTSGEMMGAGALMPVRGAAIRERGAARVQGPAPRGRRGSGGVDFTGERRLPRERRLSRGAAPRVRRRERGRHSSVILNIDYWANQEVIRPELNLRLCKNKSYHS